MTPPSLDLVYRFGGLRLDWARRLLVGRNGRPVYATAAQLHLLALLAAAWPGEVVREDVLPDLLRRRPGPENRSLDQLVFQLRQFLPRDEWGRTMIVSVRTVGYQLAVPVETYPREAA